MEWPESLALTDVALPLFLLAAGVLSGFFVERVVLRVLRKAANLTHWEGDNLLIRALKGIPLFWGAAVGIYLAALAASDTPRLTDTLNDAGRVAIVWSLVIITARLVSGSMTTYAERDESLLPATSILPNLVQLAVYAVGVLIVLRQIGVAITPVLTALGVGGLAVALALQSTLSNVFAGLYLIASRTIRPGHYVQLESGEEGYITDISWRAATVRTIYDNAVVVPNEKLASSIVTDFYLPQETMQVRMNVGVDYESDPDLVERVTLEVAREVMEAVHTERRPSARRTEAARQPPQKKSSWKSFGHSSKKHSAKKYSAKGNIDAPAPSSTDDAPRPSIPPEAPTLPEPKLFFHTFGEFSLNLIVFLRVDEYFDQYRVRHLFIKRLLARYEEEGIRIPFPIREFDMELSGETDRGPGRLARPDAQDSPTESDAISFDPPGRDS